MGDGVDAGGGDIDPDPDASKADLVAFVGDLSSKRRLDGRHVGQVDTGGGIGDGSIADKPEGFVGEVVRKGDGGSWVELIGCLGNQAHV
ncbi:hypothetical protein D3C76_1535440 [compost metagenome]